MNLRFKTVYSEMSPVCSTTPCYNISIIIDVMFFPIPENFRK